MKLPWAVPCLCLLLASCREKPAQPVPPVPTPSVSAPTVLPAKATPEQLGSTLRLRVAFGGLPARDTVAALLHHDEVNDPSLARGNCRLVIASLKGWEEAQLRSPDARLIVYRHKVNANGDSETVSFPASLVQFDEKTLLGIVAYVDTFDSAIDVGFHLQHGGDPAPADLTLLRPFQNPDPAPPAAPFAGRRTHEMRPFSVDVGTYHGGGVPRVDLPTPAPQDLPDPGALAVGAPDRLYGFVETAPTGPVITRFNGFTVDAKPTIYDVAQVVFDNPYVQDHYRINLTMAAVTGTPRAHRMWLHLREATHDEQTALPKADAGVSSFAPVTTDKVELTQREFPAGPWSAVLPDPTMDQEKFFVMQVSWPLLAEDRYPSQAGQAEVYGRPFVVKITRQTEGLTPVVLDQTPAKDSPAATFFGAATARFPLEGNAEDVHLVAGGREALLHLDSAPFWKRFSFEKSEWLPLPLGSEQATASVTGNLSALFVLDRGARVVRKYRLPDLEPAGMASLPPGDYLAILAGCDSEHAPVHLVVGTDMMSLDPDTLARCDPPPREGPNGPRFSRGLAVGTGGFFISGDGLAIRRLDRSSVQILNYNGDERGFENHYLDSTDNNFPNGVPGVTGGFTISQGLLCRDTPGGRGIEEGRPSVPWNYAPSELSENAPVIFRILRPQSRDLAPKVRLGCFAFPSAEPFIELEAPELGGVTDYELWSQHRWAFLDPHSQQLATLGADRRTWFVRKLALGGERPQPVLLNWPDTSVARGNKWTFRPVLAGGGHFGAEVVGKTVGPIVDAAAGTVSLPVAADEFAALQLLNLEVPGRDGAQAAYPILLHTSGLALPFAAPPETKPEGLNWRGAGLATLGAPSSDFHTLKAAIYPLANGVAEILGPVAGCAVLVTPPNHLDFFSLQTRRVVGSTAGPPGAYYYPGAGALLEYDPGKQTLTRISVPGAVREQVLTLPANAALTGIGVGTDRGSPITLAVDITQAEGVVRFSDLVFTRKLLQNTVAVVDGLTLKAGGRAQPVGLARLVGKVSDAASNDDFAGLLSLPDRAPSVLPASRSGSLVYLRQYFLGLGPNYAVAYPMGSQGSWLDLGGPVAGIGGGSLSGLMAFTNMGAVYKGGIKVAENFGNTPTRRQLGPTADDRYQLFFTQVFGRGESSLEICSAENGRSLLRLGRLAFVGREQGIEDSRTSRHVLMLDDSGPLAVLSESGRSLELVDLDIPAAAQQASPEDFHVVSQPVPYVMEGRTFQYAVQVNNPAAVQSVELQNPVPGVTMNKAGTVFYTAPSNITGPTHVTISLELKGRNGQVLLHEFPVYVLPWPRLATNPKPASI